MLRYLCKYCVIFPLGLFSLFSPLSALSLSLSLSPLLSYTSILFSFLIAIPCHHLVLTFYLSSFLSFHLSLVTYLLSSVCSNLLVFVSVSIIYARLLLTLTLDAILLEPPLIVPLLNFILTEIHKEVWVCGKVEKSSVAAHS